MKKLLIVLGVLTAVLFFGWTYVKGQIAVDVTDDDLPEGVYTTSPALLFFNAQYNLFQIANPLSSEDDMTLTEEYLNLMLFYSIRENINDEYDPLNDDCGTAACDVIVSTGYGDVEYAYVELNSDNKIVLHVNFNRTDFLSVETALVAVFDVDISLMEMALTLTLEDVYINDILIKESQIDWVLSQFDPKSIEASIAIGTLDLEEKTYEVGLLSSFTEEE